MGSSMRVSPFNLLPTYIKENANSVTINMDPIEHIEELNSKKSVFLQGKCDETIKDLLTKIGWEEEFNEFVEKLHLTASH